jgi:hypothetical protein
MPGIPPADSKMPCTFARGLPLDRALLLDPWVVLSVSTWDFDVGRGVGELPSAGGRL